MTITREEAESMAQAHAEGWHTPPDGLRREGCPECEGRDLREYPPAPKKPAFGLRSGLPDDGRALWGARLIWPDDLVWDRQGLTGTEPGTTNLQTWLNGGALRAALGYARLLADRYELRGSEDRTVTLYEDETGMVRGNPQNSHGYLYVAAWLKA